MKLSISDFVEQTSKIIEAKLAQAAIKGELIEVDESIRGLGKTTALINFAYLFELPVIVRDSQVARYLSELKGYHQVYSIKDLCGRGITRALINDDVKVEDLEGENITVVTGFVSK